MKLRKRPHLKLTKALAKDPCLENVLWDILMNQVVKNYIEAGIDDPTIGTDRDFTPQEIEVIMDEVDTDELAGRAMHVIFEEIGKAITAALGIDSCAGTGRGVE